MSLGKHNHTDYRTGGRVKVITAAVTLTPADTVCTIATNFSGNITLPPMAECAGKFFSFLQTGSGTSDCFVIARGYAKDSSSEDPNYTSCLTDAANESNLLYCDGRAWYLINGQTS